MVLVFGCERGVEILLKGLLAELNVCQLVCHLVFSEGCVVSVLGEDVLGFLGEMSVLEEVLLLHDLMLVE